MPDIVREGEKHQAVPSDLTLRVKSLESLLVEKGLVDPASLDALIETMEHKVGPRNGARVVARAWIDRRFGMAGSGATQIPANRPKVDFHFKSLAELAKAHREAMGG